MAISNQPDKLVWRVACSRLFLKILADFQLGVYLPAAGRLANPPERAVRYGRG